LPGSAWGICEYDEFSGDGCDDDLVWLSSLTKTVGEDFRTWVVMRCDQAGLEHDVPQSTTAPRDGPFPALRSTVTCTRRETSESCGLFTGHATELGPFGGAKLLMGADSGLRPFAHLDQLEPLRGQGFQQAQLFRGQASSCIGSESKEAGDQFRIDPVGFARVPRLCPNAFT